MEPDVDEDVRPRPRGRPRSGRRGRRSSRSGGHGRRGSSRRRSGRVISGRPCSRRRGRSGSARAPRDRPRPSPGGAGSRRRRGASRRGSRSPRPDRAARRATGPGRRGGRARASRSNSVRVEGMSAPSRVTVRPATSIDERAEPELRRSVVGGRAGAAERGADPGDQLRQVERLADVVVGARLEPDDDVHRVAAGGQHHDRARSRSCGSGGRPRSRRAAAA